MMIGNGPWMQPMAPQGPMGQMGQMGPMGPMGQMPTGAEEIHNQSVDELLHESQTLLNQMKAFRQQTVAPLLGYDPGSGGEAAGKKAAAPADKDRYDQGSDPTLLQKNAVTGANLPGGKGAAAREEAARRSRPDDGEEEPDLIKLLEQLGSKTPPDAQAKKKRSGDEALADELAAADRRLPPKRLRPSKSAPVGEGEQVLRSPTRPKAERVQKAPSVDETPEPEPDPEAAAAAADLARRNEKYAPRGAPKEDAIAEAQARRRRRHDATPKRPGQEYEPVDAEREREHKYRANRPDLLREDMSLGNSNIDRTFQARGEADRQVKLWRAGKSQKCGFYTSRRGQEYW